MFTPVTAHTQDELTSAIVREPLVVAPDTTVMAAIAKMSGVRTVCSTFKNVNSQQEDLHIEARSSCVLIVEDQRLLGILTERDIVRLSAQKRSLDNLAIRDVMASKVITLRESAFTDLFFAVNLLQQHHIRHIPVLDDRDRLVGLLTHESLRQTSRPVDLLRLRTVAEVMTSEVICAVPNVAMLEIARLMNDRRVSSVVIVEFQVGRHQESLQIPMGIVTERDIVQFQALNLDLETCQAQVVMSTPIFSVNLEDSLWVVQQIMEQRSIRRLAVTGSQGELLGIVTQTSILQALNPLELYKLAEVLENKVLRLETEKIDLLESRNTELERQVAERTATLQAKVVRERLITSISSQIRSSLNLQEILDTTVEEVRTFLECDRVAVWQFQTDWSAIVVAESNTDGNGSHLGQRVYDPCFADWIDAYRNGKIRVVSDIYTTEMSECHRNLLENLQIRAKVLVPILYKETLWGVVNATESHSPREWQTDEIALLEQLAAQLAIAIQQATAYQQVQAELLQRQRAESELLESKHFVDAIANNSPQLLYVFDPITGRYLYVNNQSLDLLGYISEEIRQRGLEFFVDILHPQDLPQFMQNLLFWENAQDSEVLTAECRMLHQDGSWHWMRSREVIFSRNDNGIPNRVLGTAQDITDLKASEQALNQLNQSLEAKVDERTFELKEREEQMRSLSSRLELAVKSAQIGIWEWDVVLDKLIWNEQMHELYGTSPSSFDGSYEVWLSRLHPDDRPNAQIFTKLVLQGAVEYDTEFRITHPNGAIKCIKAYALVNRDPQGIATRLIGVNFDISDRKRTETRLQEQAQREALLREITQRIRQSLDLSAIFDTACQEIRQFMHTDLVGIFKFHPDSNFNDGEFVAESVLEGFDSVLAIKIHDHCFGEQYAIHYQQGKIQAVDDIYNAGLLDCHRDVLAQFQIRANLIVPLLNGEDLWGLLCIHQCSDSRHWKKFEIEFIQQIANQLAIAIQQASLLQQLQKELVERLAAETKLTESNQQLAISNEELLRATRLKDEFLANMSHELRTPLNAILGMAEGLQEEVFGEITIKQRLALQTIERSGSHLLELINDILELAKIEAEQVQLHCTSVSIEQICLASLAFIKQQAYQKQLQIEVKIQPNLPTILLDERRIRQVLINLLNNAVKFTPEGGHITLEAMLVSPQPSSLQNFVQIAVTDTGIGIAPENLNKLFKPFVQIDGALNRKYEGTGLGLALVKRIVELHGGAVDLITEVGVGSRFTVNLPCNILSLESSDAANNIAPELNFTFQEPEEPVETIKLPLILLAEDNEANISTLSSYLSAKGYRMVVAKNGQEAIDLTKANHPDLILMDIQMPVLDGLEAIKQIRDDRQFAHIPIIALTALAMPGDREKCLAAGANEYLTKPVKLKQLANVMQQLLAVKDENK
ncbi:GAF domain-containing protein [Tumidithrix elongata RA019]|uniref:Circadian input-output histidine kinase CikA n=1 Tax=Tumidithrix elongata BACA0141 TaxID=2716417 RepID=A0AAW9Q1I7_9CYAN|nr:GAF domain-containing protein [Tumidithrix elongata RA019]